MTQNAKNLCAGLRIGAVSYLNSKPLVRGLSQAMPEASIDFDLPSRLADRLAAGQLDVALVPIIEYLRQSEFRLVSNACVGCRSRVMSVKVFFRKPPPKVTTLALDEGSRTSAALAQVLLAEAFDLRPQLVRLPIGDRLRDSNADAVLLIGDRAMHEPEEQFHTVWDLGDRWNCQTSLPFVFAAWVAAAELPCNLLELAAILESVRDQGVADARGIAHDEASNVGIDPQVAYDYLTENLHFRMGKPELCGMQEFAKRCQSLGLLKTSIAPQRFTFTTPLSNCSAP